MNESFVAGHHRVALGMSIVEGRRHMARRAWALRVEDRKRWEDSRGNGKEADDE